MGRYRTPQSVQEAIGARQKKRDYSNIRIPVLAFYEFPRSAGGAPRPDEYQPKNAEERSAIGAFGSATAAYVERWKKNLLSGVPSARIVDLPGAGHFVFLTLEADVLRGVQEFVAGLR